ncbi:ABC transporter substrate-binding protein [Actinacidiphila acididurans]|uniref:non-specific serine/threonine protein kinase n=1 Tax=Actinacidiphila acididurans TaxID=2784346 RepID=A0ABS2TQN7_9ACTN|nr:ABC transporter substrate-binding protein [Actinacidiphila acididurans]MBM9505652.1 protein kinase [Actinacidiphila acididurans]
MADGLFADRYELAELLGSGGMARVQRARDTRMGRTVAIKTLLPELASDPDARRRFAREAQAAGALNHHGIVTVHDQDEVHEGDTVVPYLVMEYVEGITLAQLVRDQVMLAPERAVRIACDILDALAHAHSHGTVHRDVKPGNVLITTEGAVKVADFGIARVLDNDARLTTTGSAIGTPSYMSPEQIDGADVDARSDVYSVACVLVELLTGKPPFTDGNPLSLMYWHVHTAPPAPSSRNPRVPRELDALVLAALAKNPADRPAGAAAFRDRLRAWLVTADPSTLSGPAADPVPHPGAPGRGPGAAGTPTPDRRPADPRFTYGVGAKLPALPAAGPATPATPAAPATPATPPAAAPAAGPGPAAAATPPGAVHDATPPPPRQPEHPAYSRAPQVPLPPPYLPGTPPPVNIQATPENRPQGGSRRRWILAAAGVAVAATAVTVPLVVIPGGGKHHDDSRPTPGPTTSLRTAALALHGGKEGTGYDGGLSGVIRPSTKRGGTLRLAAVKNGGTDLLDPAATYDQPSWNVQRLYLRKLVDYAPAPGDKGRTLVPDLATDTGKVSADGLTWTFHLKSGVSFDTGAPITSKDVKYGIERTFDRGVFGGGPTYFVDLLDQQQNYPGPYKDSDPDKMGLRSVDTPDDSTIVFHLAKPFADFRYVLALSMGAPIPASADTGGGKDFEKHPVGSGPYKVGSYVPGTSLTLVRNPYWKQSTDTVHSALPDTIRLTYYDTQQEVEQAVLGGTADLDLNAGILSDQGETKILNDPSLKANADLVFTGSTRFISLQTSVRPFDTYQCRRAIQYAVDRSSIRALLGGQYDGGDVATTMLPPTADGYDPNATPYGTTQGLPYPDQAKQQLTECGHPNGFNVTLAGPQGAPRIDDVMQSIKTSLAAVGITVTIQTEQTSDFYATLLSPAKLRAKNWGMVLTGWAADWPTGGGFLRSLIEPGSPNNYAGLDDSDINKLVDTADTQSDPTEAAGTWRTIDAKEMGESTMVPLIYVRHLLYRGPHLTNVYEQQVLGGVDLTALGVQS